jgi:hypothetical protein
MANFYGKTRSNYFAVKDPEAFVKELGAYPVRVITQEQDGVTLYGFTDNDEDNEGNVWTYYDDEKEEYIEVNWLEVFKQHLQDDWVAVIMECGSEKYRYLSGFTIAYNNKGESKSLGLSDIYSLASGIGSKITEASY